MQIKLKDHTFQIDPGQNKHYWSHINSVDWEPHTFAIFDYFIDGNSVVLDIGAWSGVLTLYAAETAKEVHALDPDPVCFKELQTNINLNPRLSAKISAYPVAISDKEEEVSLSARSQYGASSTSILQRNRDTEHSSKVTTIDLLNFLSQEKINKVDFIKMDVEGAEFKILPGIGKALKKLDYPTFYVSFHYDFLNEHLYQKYIRSRFLNKLFLKLEKTFRFSILKYKIRREIKDLYHSLLAYQYIYNTEGHLITKTFLEQHPEYIKDYDLVFTNREWKK